MAIVMVVLHGIFCEIFANEVFIGLAMTFKMVIANLLAMTILTAIVMFVLPVTIYEMLVVAKE